MKNSTQDFKNMSTTEIALRFRNESWLQRTYNDLGKDKMVHQTESVPTQNTASLSKPKMKM